MSPKKFTLEELATLTNSKLIGNPTYSIHGLSDLENATETDASFYSNPRYEQAMRFSHAGVIIIDTKTSPKEGGNYLIHDNPSAAFQILIDHFFGTEKSNKSTGFPGIHATAVIHPSCNLGPNITIGPYAVIDQNTEIGENSVISAGCYIGSQVKIGKDCLLHPRVTIRECCDIGDRVILQPGVVIGSCGYGYDTDKKGVHHKLNQLGNVHIEDDVEIGANTTVDRARFKSTRIGQGTKIDNLVMIAHGVIVGKHSLIVAQTGIAGSTEIGNHVILAGQTAVAGHLKVADRSIVTARSGISKSITKAGEKWGGVPVMPLSDYNRMSVMLRNVESYVNQIKDLQSRVKKLES